MAKAYTFSASGGLVPVDALEAATSINIASSAFVADTNGITMGSNKDITLSGGGEILGLPTTPSASDAAASKAYVQSYADSVASGLDVKKSVVAATTAALTDAVTYDNGASGVGATLTSNSNAAMQQVDGVSLSVGDRVLIKDQADPEQNGIYVVTNAGNIISAPYILTRATDADTGGANGEMTPGMFCFVEQGSTNADTGWVLSSPDTAITMGTTEVTFTQFSSSGTITAGAGLTKTGGIIDVVSGNSAIVVNTNDITLTLATNSGLEISSGLKMDLDSNSGLALGAGGVKLDVSALASGAGVFSGSTIDDDYFPYYDVANSATKYVGFAQLASTMAGNGLAASGGVLALALSELSTKASPDSLDMITLVDASDSSSKKASMASLAAIMAGLLDGGALVVESDELAVNVDNSTIEISSDAIQVKDLGITEDKLAASSVTADKLLLSSDSSSLVSNAAITAPLNKAAYVVTATGKVALAANSQAGMHVQGLLGNGSDISAANEDVSLYTVDGSFLSIASAARDSANFTPGAIVYAIASGLLTTDFANDIDSGDWCCPVGTSVGTDSLILRIGLPFQKA